MDPDVAYAEMRDESLGAEEQGYAAWGLFLWLKKDGFMPSAAAESRDDLLDECNTRMMAVGI